MRSSLRALRATAVTALLACTAMATGACGSDEGPTKSDADYRAEITSGMRGAILGDLRHMLDAARDLQAATPLPRDTGWDAQADADSIAVMRAAWITVRAEYEHVEGAIEATLPDLDAAIDSRYEQSLARIGPAGDAYAFDELGMVGLDAIERILYADVTPARVIAYERTLPGYAVAAFPSNANEALDFKTKLCARLVADIESLVTHWSQAELDLAAVFAGITGVVAEQRAELDEDATHAEESRYSQRAMDSLRDNMEGVQAIYGLYRPWLASKSPGNDVDARIESGLGVVNDAYMRVAGDDLPAVPATWNAQSPSPADTQTEFGQLFAAVSAASDANRDGSLLHEMRRASDILGFQSR